MLLTLYFKKENISWVVPGGPWLLKVFFITRLGEQTLLCLWLAVEEECRPLVKLVNYIFNFTYCLIERKKKTYQLGCFISFLNKKTLYL